jgi:hypothetical protein
MPGGDDMSVSGHIRDQAADHAAYELDQSARRARVRVVRAARTPEQLRDRLNYALANGDMRLFVDRIDLAMAATAALEDMVRGWDLADVALPTPLTDLIPGSAHAEEEVAR